VLGRASGVGILPCDDIKCIQGSAKEPDAYEVIVANIMDYRYNLIEL